jgi:hypothetical protein
MLLMPVSNALGVDQVVGFNYSPYPNGYQFLNCQTLQYGEACVSDFSRSQGTKNVYNKLKSLLESADSTPQVLSIGGWGENSSNELNFENDNGTITVQNKGLPRTCNMSMEQATSGQNSNITINNIAIKANSTVYIEPSNWNDLSNSTVTIDDVGRVELNNTALSQ